MNKLRPITAIGTPYHGLALNDQVIIGSRTFTVSDTPAGATVGPAVPIRHPNAPGAVRNTAQQAHDAANGLEWRSVALAVGHSRSIDGADGGGGIGRNRWLYCDPSTDATWLIRLEVMKNTGDIDFEVWLDGVFGRFGRNYSNTPRLLASLNWVPDIPSWGSESAATVVASVDTDSIATIAFSQSGGQAYINLFANGGGLSSGSYQPTSITAHDWGLIQSLCLVGILRVDLSGSSTALAGGAAISATLVQDLAYEGGIVTLFDNAGTDRSSTAILYKSPDGTVSRAFAYNLTTGVAATTVNVFGHPINLSCTAPVPDYSSGSEVRIYAQNAVYVCNYDDGGTLHTFNEWWVGLDADGVVYEVATNSRLDTWEAPNSGYSEMPYTRRQVFSYDPVAGLVNIDTNTFLQTYTGDHYQFF